ncbi:MAG: coenzyme F420-0:L-glutamate ligase [Anaerolineales bacterium]|jgi:coenzyme F420-0:L-glutamate ligase/coenzyme F420-1:gamma-L-glutamate ligase
MTLPVQLILTALPGIPLIKPGDDLASLILEALESAELTLGDGDVLAVAQKVVSKAEGRLVNLTEVTPSPEAERLGLETEKDPRLVHLILEESREILRTRPGLIIVEHRLGFVCANAGVDHSNIRGPTGQPQDWVLLLPQDPDASAQELRRRIREATQAEVGILIIDSHGRAWRMGTVGVAIGAAGFPALVDLRGWPDLYGDLLKATQVGLADELAAAASILMGQASEGRPVIHVRGLPYPLRNGSLPELLRPRAQDLFR